MKLNFWQWIGVFLIVVALVVYFLWDKPRRDLKKEATPVQGGSLPVPASTLVA